MKWYGGTISVPKSAIFNNCALRAFVCVCVCVRTTRVFARMNYARYDVIIAKHAEISSMFRFNLIHLKNKPIGTCIPRVSSSSVYRDAFKPKWSRNICVTESQWFLPSNCSLCKLLITDSMFQYAFAQFGVRIHALSLLRLAHTYNLLCVLF